MRVLAITNIFPNSQAPTAAPYNRIQFAELARRGCTVDVLATIPWFPGTDRFRSYSPHANDVTKVPHTERIEGLPVTHPRTLYLPKIGLAASGPLYAASLLPYVLRYRGKVDVVLSAWAYPDGWASVLIGKLLGVPAVIKLHGSDINSIAEQPTARRMLKWVMPHAARIIAVNSQLARKTAELGVDPARIDVVYNGVESATFRVADRARARAELGRAPNERMILYVGNVKRSKGAIDLLEAFERVARDDERATLVVIGRGVDAPACRAIAERIGSDRVTFAGPQPHTVVARWLAACDISTLPSWNEGTPNTVLEALACGRRVVATHVGGIPDLITSEELGELVPPRDIDALSAALSRALARDYEPESVAAKGRRGDWADSGAAMHAVLERAIGAL